MFIKKLSSALFPLMLLTACFNGEDVQGKIVIEYNGEWSALITENFTESSHTGNGPGSFIYKNPERLKATVNKSDSSLNKLIIYIYEDERIAAEGSTREPGGCASAEYEFPY